MDRSNEAFDFAIRVAELVRYLREKPERFPLAAEMLAAGVRAGMAARDLEDLTGPAETSRAREAAAAVDEVRYYLEMAVRSGYATDLEASRIRQMGADLHKALVGDSAPSTQHPFDADATKPSIS
ncbi:four helix bundle protein [Raoultibacter phocaeensis]|uniref:four helix bundle protein n=1 Tax=Raoultibacter phocaeensis TaxID=2479841 RepID=UPI001118997D|nr:four helix bundle protein [Raoultibacter phocaeensis]